MKRKKVVRILAEKKVHGESKSIVSKSEGAAPIAVFALCVHLTMKGAAVLCEW